MKSAPMMVRSSRLELDTVGEGRGWREEVGQWWSKVWGRWAGSHPDPGPGQQLEKPLLGPAWPSLRSLLRLKIRVNM